jgi:IS30 family transposase
VGFKPRKGGRPKRATRHAKKRSYEAFCSLAEERQASATEMDCVEGLERNAQVLLTLYHRPSHLQIAVLLPEHTCQRVLEALGRLRSLCRRPFFSRLFGTVLTDNGHEFEDEEALERAFSGQTRKVHLYYCDPRQSQQKGGCEKGHSGIRELLPKGRVDFDGLGPCDIAVVNSHVNSSPRPSLCGLSPIDMFIAAYGDDGKGLLEALGIEKVSRDELTLDASIINIEREKRRECPLAGL